MDTLRMWTSATLRLITLAKEALRVWTSVPSLPGLASSITIAIAGWR